MKKFFQLLLTLTLIFAVSACTSKKVDDQADEATAEMTGEEGADAEVSEEEFGSEEAPVAESEASESADSSPVAESSDEATASDDMEGLAESTESAPAEGATESTDVAASSEGSAEATDSSDTEGLAAQETTSASEPIEPTTDSATETAQVEEPAAPKAMVPLRKIETQTWTQAGVLVNTVYLARPGDDFSKVSQKIYGSEEKVSELKKINPTIAAREMKVGDKVYYNSPKRPTDSTQLITFFEDNGLAPETYVSQPGDNIRTVAKTLLGDNNSWKEVWSTNLDVESKSELPEGTRLRYWAGEVAAPVLAQQPEAAPQPEALPEEAPPVAAGTVAANETPPPPAEMAAPPPPAEEIPAAPVEQAPPPQQVQESLPPEPVIAEAPPAPSDAGPSAALDGSSSGNPLADLLGGQDQTTALMIGALLLIAAAALFIIIRKRKAKKNIDFQTATHTQIE